MQFFVKNAFVKNAFFVKNALVVKNAFVVKNGQFLAVFLDFFKNGVL